MGRGPNWTTEELRILQEHYEHAPKAELLTMLPDRSAEALKIRAGRLGLRRRVGVSYSRQSPLRRELSDAELAYLAGIIDGEGHITVVRAQRRNSRFPLYSPRVGVTNQSERLIEWMDERVAWTIRDLKPTKGEWGWAYRPAVVGHAVADLLEVLLPFLVIKAEQATLVIRFCAMRSLSPTGQPLSEMEIETAEAARALNRPRPAPTSALLLSKKSVSKRSTT
jgi:hypothetical protein